MSTFLDRLKEEQRELDEKLIKLNDYIENNSHFESLTDKNKILLKEQRVYMKKYNVVLKDRIELNSLI